jgi:hypothetical protein
MSMRPGALMPFPRAASRRLRYHTRAMSNFVRRTLPTAAFLTAIVFSFTFDMDRVSVITTQPHMGSVGVRRARH